MAVVSMDVLDYNALRTPSAIHELIQGQQIDLDVGGRALSSLSSSLRAIIARILQATDLLPCRQPSHNPPVVYRFVSTDL